MTAITWEIEYEYNGFPETKAKIKRNSNKVVKGAAEIGATTMRINCPISPFAKPHLIDTVGYEITVGVASVEAEISAGDPAKGIDYTGYVEWGTQHDEADPPYNIAAQPFVQPGFEAGRAALLFGAERILD